MSENVTPRQRRAIEALTTTGQVTDAAKAAKVARRTVYRWMREDAFRGALAEAEAEALAALSRELVGMGTDATATIRATMADKTASPTVRLRAADIVLGRLLQLRELVALEDRVQALEDKIGGTSWRR